MKNNSFEKINDTLFNTLERNERQTIKAGANRDEVTYDPASGGILDDAPCPGSGGKYRR